MSIFRRKKPSLATVLAEHDLTEAMAAVQPPIPAGTRIYTSASPKVTVAHVKSARNPGAVCEAMSLRDGPWLGTGSDEERQRALSLRLCTRCAMGDYGENRAAS